MYLAPFVQSTPPSRPEKGGRSGVLSMPRWLRVRSQSHAPHSFWTPWAPACPSHGGGTEPRCASRRPAFGYVLSVRTPVRTLHTLGHPPKADETRVFAFSLEVYICLCRIAPPPRLSHPLACVSTVIRASLFALVDTSVLGFDPRNQIAISSILSLGTALLASLPSHPRLPPRHTQGYKCSPARTTPSSDLFPRTN
jgi:hypothetical protein